MEGHIGSQPRGKGRPTTPEAGRGRGILPERERGSLAHTGISEPCLQTMREEISAVRSPQVVVFVRVAPGREYTLLSPAPPNPLNQQKPQ